MNDKAKKAARRAELEFALLQEWQKYSSEGFGTFIKRQAQTYNSPIAKELIALYEGELA